MSLKCSMTVTDDGRRIFLGDTGRSTVAVLSGSGVAKPIFALLEPAASMNRGFAGV
jgi:hypothetical protein